MFTRAFSNSILNSALRRDSRSGCISKLHVSGSKRGQLPKPQPSPPTPLRHKIRDSFLVLEAQQGPLGKTIVGIGQGLFAGGLLYGTGALLYYGLFQEENVILADAEDVPKYPDYVGDRMHTAYMYLFNSLSVSGVSAVASFKVLANARVLNAIATHPLAAIGIMTGTQMLLTMFVRSLPYKEGIGAKQIGSVAHAALIGLAAAPMYLLGAQSIVRAGFVTAGVAGGLTALSTILPNDILNGWERPLRVGMYGVVLAFMSLWFVPRFHPMYSILFRVAMHGGLMVFPAYYLFNSKALLQSAIYSNHFDPINASMGLYTDLLNIYGRLAFLLPPHYFISGHPKVPAANANPDSK